MLLFSIDIFFFFKQKTAYDMRISDWRSDVCSSDLLVLAVGANEPQTFAHLVMDVRVPHQAVAAAVEVHCQNAVFALEPDVFVPVAVLTKIRLVSDQCLSPTRERFRVSGPHPEPRERGGQAALRYWHRHDRRSEAHTSELQSLMRISY